MDDLISRLYIYIYIYIYVYVVGSSWLRMNLALTEWKILAS